MPGPERKALQERKQWSLSDDNKEQGFFDGHGGSVEACQDEGLIKGATHAGPILFLDSTKLTVKGLEYLHENSAVMKTYK